MKKKLLEAATDEYLKPLVDPIMAKIEEAMEFDKAARGALVAHKSISPKDRETMRQSLTDWMSFKEHRELMEKAWHLMLKEVGSFRIIKRLSKTSPTRVAV